MSGGVTFSLRELRERAEDRVKEQRGLSMGAAEVLALVEAADALWDEHELHCGCEQPGHLTRCGLDSHFAALARFTDHEETKP